MQVHFFSVLSQRQVRKVHDPFSAKTARISFPLTADSGARVFVTECDTGCCCVRRVGDIFVSSTDSLNIIIEEIFTSRVGPID